MRNFCDKLFRKRIVHISCMHNFRAFQKIKLQKQIACKLYPQVVCTSWMDLTQVKYYIYVYILIICMHINYMQTCMYKLDMR